MIRRGRFVCHALMFIAVSHVASAGWLDERFAHKGDALPFSFTCGGKTYAGVVPANWKAERLSSELDSQRLQETIIWSDPETGLEVRCEAVDLLNTGFTITLAQKPAAAIFTYEIDKQKER